MRKLKSNENLDLEYLSSFVPINVKVQKDKLDLSSSYPTISLMLPDSKFGLFFENYSDSVYPFNPECKNPVQTCFLGFYCQDFIHIPSLFLSVIEDSPFKTVNLFYLTDLENRLDVLTKAQKARSLMKQLFNQSIELPYLSNNVIQSIVKTL